MMHQESIPKAVDISNVRLIELFTRVSPPCHFCIEARKLLQQNFSNTKMVEYGIGENPAEWKKLVSRYPGARIPPQVVLTGNNGARWLLGGLAELREVFQSPG